jgi:hypothetical protein
MESPPIACSLSASDYRERLAAITEVGASSLINVDERLAETVMRFRFSSESRDKLQTIVSKEAECCAFLDLSLTTSNDELVLRLVAPDEARPIVDDLVGSLRGGGMQRTS